MSYAGPASRSRSAAATSPGAAARTGRPAAARGTAPRPVEEDSGWRQLAVFGAGLALGIAVGAGAALLTAPRTGSETRAALAARAARARRTTSRRGHDAWDDLRLEIRSARRALLHRKRSRELENESAPRS
jgi:hypothetical protein